MSSLQTQSVQTGRITRTFIYLFLLLMALFYLLPFFIMVVNSVKPLSEITGGNMMALPEVFTIEPWLAAWSTAQVGVEPTGLRPYFWNSIKMVVPAVAISTVLGAINGYILTAFQIRHHSFWTDVVFLFHPVPDCFDPHGTHIGDLGPVWVNLWADLGACGVWNRIFYVVFPKLLCGFSNRTCARGTD